MTDQLCRIGIKGVFRVLPSDFPVIMSVGQGVYLDYIDGNTKGRVFMTEQRRKIKGKKTK